MGREESFFDLPGKALGQYVSDYSKFCELIKRILSDGGNISRCDLAIDVKDKMTFSPILKAVRAGLVVSKSRNVKIVEKFENSAGSLHPKGATVYIGSGKSSKFLRIYDKAAEQKVSGDWIRWEMQLRDDQAKNYLKAFVGVGADRAGDYILGLVAGFVDFRKNDYDNITRRSRISWFEKFVGSVKPVKILFEKIVGTIDDVVQWVDRQVAPSLALLKVHFGDSFSSVFDFIMANGSDRLRDKHFALLRSCVSGSA